MRLWSIGVTFILCSAEVQRHWLTPEGYIFLTASLLTAGIWLGTASNVRIASAAADFVVEIIVVALLSSGMVIQHIGQTDLGRLVVMHISSWAPLICAWWGLSLWRIRAKTLVVLTAILFGGLSVGMPPDASTYSFEYFLLSFFVLGLTRHWSIAQSSLDTGIESSVERDGDFRDVETGIYNREYFEAEVSHLAAIANRYPIPFSVIALQVNWPNRTRESSRSGDLREVEKKIAWRIAERIRTADTAAYWGERRFVVLLPHTNAPQADELASLLAGSIGMTLRESIGNATVLTGTAEHQAGEDPMGTVSEAERLLERNLTTAEST